MVIFYSYVQLPIVVYLVGGIPTPIWKNMDVNWEDYSHIWGKKKSCSSHHQPDICIIPDISYHSTGMLCIWTGMVLYGIIWDHWDDTGSTKFPICCRCFLPVDDDICIIPEAQYL